MDVVAQFGAGGGIAQRHLGPRVLRVQREIVFDFDGDADVGMIPQIPPDAGGVQDYRNAQIPKFVRGAYARQHQ